MGCGRGPLITRILRASESQKKSVIVYAIEKNINTQSYLEAKFHKKKDIVKFFFCDIRDYKVVEKSDILVSELLGSFGDNELAPECLD